MNLEEFIKEARKNNDPIANQTKEVIKSTFQKEDFCYFITTYKIEPIKSNKPRKNKNGKNDRHYIRCEFMVRETVKKDEKSIWAMNYFWKPHTNLKGKRRHQVHEFIQYAINQPENRFEEKDLKYEDTLTGRINILSKNQEIYTLNYTGGSKKD